MANAPGNGDRSENGSRRTAGTAEKRQPHQKYLVRLPFYTADYRIALS
ncbi:hypothetical protein IWX64_001932 [Arthrobacter sp. CAN_A212]|nr:hypothetical protein [Arthrobacter sp. CAN_C5]